MAYTFFQQWAGKVINCIFSINFIPNQLIIVYSHTLFCFRLSTDTDYMELVLCRSLIIILDLGVLCDQCYQMNLIEIFTSMQIQDKDFVYINFFHCTYIYLFIIYFLYTYVMYPQKIYICNIFCYAWEVCVIWIDKY